MANGTSCPTCKTPIPGDALFCPGCGLATPTISSGGEGAAAAGPAEGTGTQAEHLQRALGPDFRVDRLLGSGGFAEVYAAEDLKLARQVAVKVLRSDLVISESLLERFQREARAVAKLRHPNIVPIYAVGQREGLAYYVMPMVEGETLRQRLRREGPLPVDEVRRVLCGVAAALATAHKADIVHRDIKPENVMFDGDERRVLVMDFGIAKLATSSGAGITATGVVIGTPHYMSPEQASGSRETDFRSDLYSLGVVGYEMLAGKPPFAGETPQSVILKQIAADPPPITTLRADVPDDLQTALDLCLAKKSAERWASAADLAAFLDAHVPAAAKAQAGPRRRRRWRVPIRFEWVAYGSLLLALAAAALVGVRSDLRWIVRDFWGLGPAAAPVEEPTDGIVAAGWSAGRRWSSDYVMVPLGDRGLAVVDRQNTAEGVHVFDGLRWTSFRTPEVVQTLAEGGDRAWLIGQRRVYRLSSTGVVPVGDGPPFPRVEFAWSDGTDLLVGGNRQLAWRRGTTWTPDPTTPRSRTLQRVFGTQRDRLYATGEFSNRWSERATPDSLVEYRGFAWQSRDVRPDSTRRWFYGDGMALRGGALVVAGADCPRAQERCALLLLSAERAGAPWRRVELADAPPRAWSQPRVWGLHRDSVFVWNAWCDSTPCLWEVTEGRMSAVTEVGGGGRIIAMAAIAGAPVALREDGTLWTRRLGQWGFIGEVPNETVVDYTEYAKGGSEGYRAWARVGPGHVSGRFSADSSLPDRLLAPGPAFAGTPVAVALGRHLAWILRDDGQVLLLDCRAPDPACRTGVEPDLPPSVRGLAQRPGGGAVAVGPGGFAAVASPYGGWRRLPAFAEESLVAASAAPNGRLALLGERHLFDVDSAGSREIVDLPLRLSHSRFDTHLDRGRSAVATPTGVVGWWGPRGEGFGTEDIDWRARRIVGVAGVPGNRLAIALAEPAEDPFSAGAVIVARLAPNRAALTQGSLELPVTRSSLRGVRTYVGRLLVWGIGAREEEWRLATGRSRRRGVR